MRSDVVGVQPGIGNQVTVWRLCFFLLLETFAHSTAKLLILSVYLTEISYETFIVGLFGILVINLSFCVEFSSCSGLLLHD